MAECFKQVMSWEDRRKLSVLKLCFVINVLNNKTIILLNIAEYLLILANLAS